MIPEQLVAPVTHTVQSREVGPGETVLINAKCTIDLCILVISSHYVSAHL